MKVSSPVVVWYLIIVPIFILVKYFPGLFNVFDPLMVAWTTPFGNLNLSSKQSAVNVGYPDTPVWYTDLISSVEYAVTVPIVLGKSIPLIINCSPTENVPEVWLKVIVVDPPPAETAYPLAPLLLPFTNDVAGNSKFETEEFKTNAVYVWIS